MTMLTTLKPHKTGTVPANGIDLYYEAFGDPKHPAVLLIMGLSSQCLQWFPYFYESIVNAGYYVIRFDNRDLGLSTWIDPDEWLKSPYNLEDLAGDAVGLLQALGIQKAHIIGASMGGAIAQRLAISHRDRVLSLTSMISFADATALGRRGILSSSPIDKRPSLEEYLWFWSMLVGSRFPLNIPLYSELYRECFEVRKGFNPHCRAHQLEAIERSGSRMDELRKIAVPTLVFYGTEDPLIPSAHASEYAKLIPDVKLVSMDGVGHEVPKGISNLVHRELFDLFSEGGSTA